MRAESDLLAAEARDEIVIAPAPADGAETHRLAVFVFRSLLQSERKAWILGDVLKPLLPSMAVAALGRWLMPDDLGVFFTLVSLALLTALASAASLLVSGELFRRLLQRLHAKPSLF